MIHLDLFSGIGGFAYAADAVFGDVEHIFCDNDKFCQQVLNKHWPEAKIYDDIRTITNTTLKGLEQSREARRSPKAGSTRRGRSANYSIDLLTGGFPCQPFSAAGLRRGTADDRHLWPEMLRVIKLTQPTWVIAENVRGLLTWDEGLVFEQVCADLEAEGYDVQPFIIPAVGVNAPHRRDRIWFVANRQSDRTQGGFQQQNPNAKLDENIISTENPRRQRSRGRSNGDTGRHNWQVQDARSGDTRFGWETDWLEVAAELCGVDDGLPAELDGFKLSKAGHRKERLKSLGNAIVPAVAVEIMKGMIYEPK